MDSAGPVVLGNLSLLYNDKLLSSNQQNGAMPLRLTQVRDAIFFIYPWASRYTSLREATGYLHGIELSCILLAQGFGGRSPQGGRNWDESEYCIDPKTGLLATYSPVPGLYVQYDYTNAIHFHRVIIPEKFTISEAGRIVIEANTQGVTDPVAANNRMFDPSSLHALGVGAVVNPSGRVRDNIYPPAAQPMVSENGRPVVSKNYPAPPNPNAVLQVVIVHAIVSPEGQVSESEILASSNISLNQAALDRVNGWKTLRRGVDNQPGTTPQWREIIFTLESASPPM